MTVGRKVKQTLANLKGVESTLKFIPYKVVTMKKKPYMISTKYNKTGY